MVAQAEPGTDTGADALLAADADADLDVLDGADVAAPETDAAAAAAVEDAGDTDTGDDTDTEAEPVEIDWSDPEQVQAYVDAQVQAQIQAAIERERPQIKSETRRELEPAFARDVRRAGEALRAGQPRPDGLAAGAWRTAKDLYSEQAAAAGADVSETREEAANWSKFLRIEQAGPSLTPYEVRDRAAYDPNFEHDYYEWFSWLAKQGMEPTTTVDTVRQGFLAAKEREARAAFRTQLAQADPDSYYDALREAPEWSRYSEAQRAQLNPDAIDGSDIEKLLRLAERRGAFNAELARGERATAAAARARGTGAEAQTAARLAQQTPPVPAGGAPARPQNYAAVRDEFLAKVAAGTATRADRERYDRAAAVIRRR